MANAGTYNHTKQHFAEGAAAATPDAGEVVVYAKTDGLLYSKDDAGTETLVSGGSGGGGDITGDDAWVAKGDLIAGTTTDTAGIVTVGSNGSSLRANSGATQGIEWQKNNLAASAAPTADDDTGDGYSVGSRWIDTTADKEYVCLDATSTAAVWTETTQSGGGGLDTGTSFPGSPSSGDRYKRTDIGDVGMVFVWDGSANWLSEQLFQIPGPNVDNASTSGIAPGMPSHVVEGMDVWLERLSVSCYVNGTNNASNFWSMQVQKQAGAGSATNVGSPVTTAASSGSQWLNLEGAIGAVATYATAKVLKVNHTKTLSPGNLFAQSAIYYRHCITP